jgi:hypothetical protein
MMLKLIFWMPNLNIQQDHLIQETSGKPLYELMKRRKSSDVKASHTKIETLFGLGN